MPGTSDSIAVVRRVYDAIARGDMTGLEPLLSPDCVWYLGGDNALAGAHRGREAVFDVFARMYAATGGTYSIEPLSDAETALGSVLVHARVQAIGKTGTLDEDVIHQLEVRDGMIASCRVYRENGHLFDALIGPPVIDLVVEREKSAAY